jgi:hypothetical protein
MSDSDICSDDEKYGGMGSAMANSLHHHSGHSARTQDQAFPAPGTQVAALTVVRSALENKQIIMIRVKDQTGEETMFKMYNSTKMSKVFRAYEKNKVVEKASLCFLFKGKIILEVCSSMTMIRLFVFWRGWGERQQLQSSYCWCLCLGNVIKY